MIARTERTRRKPTPGPVIDPYDRSILRQLADEVAELAGRPIEAEKRRLWYDHNELRPTRPLIYCEPENGWNEVIPQSALRCTGELARGWEWGLRREIYSATILCDDRVMQPFIDVSYIHTNSGWGLAERKIGGDHGGAYTWEAPLKSYDMLAQMHYPATTIDHEASEELLETAQSTFCGILSVRRRTFWYWSVGLTWQAINVRGLEQIMLDMLDRPDEFRALMAFLSDGTISWIKSLESDGLLSLNNDGSYVGSGGFGWTTELPQEGFDGHVRLRDMWGLGESQETVGVSPRMFAECVLPYQLPILELFGLTCYGCCEPLDKRWQYVKQIPNLRRVSVSPWSDRAKMAENLGANYVYSMKPNPAEVAMDVFDEDSIRRGLRESLEAARGCHVEVILKDVHTIRNDPDRLIRWTRIAREESDRIASTTP